VERLYQLKGEIVSRGVASVTNITMKVFDKRRFQHGALPAEAMRQRLPLKEADYRKYFLAQYL
jgi:asparagine synthase (glutamine-hydrolysing)